MGLDASTLRRLTTEPAAQAWRTIVKQTVEITMKPLNGGDAASDVVRRDREVATLDHFLAASAWDLWASFPAAVERTSERLVRWWREPFTAKAVLILDGLSLRELPWLLQGVQERGLVLHEYSANASELPGETNEFARALGFSSRSQLQNNGGGLSHRLQRAHTESVDLPWKDCEALIDGSPNWIFWHHWPDRHLHDVAGAGQGLEVLTRSAAEHLRSDEFWSFVERLASGRRLVITSDHGYAASGLFPDAEGEVGQFLKQAFASGRCVRGAGDTGPFVPPVALLMDGSHDKHRMALGRWKWRSQGGYPTLTHGGLSLLEVLSPFVEISK